MEATKKTTSITVQDVPVTIMNVDQRDYISLTDMARARTDAGRAADVIKNWLRARSTLEFLGTWEIMYNPNFKVVEFDHFEIRVVHDLPRSEEFQRGSGAEPVFNDIGGTSCIGTGSCHIGQADVVPLINIHNRHGNILNSYRCCLFCCFHIIPLF